MLSTSVWPIDRTLSGATTLGQSGPGSDGNEEVLCFPQSSGLTLALPSDCLMLYPGHLLEGGSYPSAEMESVYSTAPNPADKAGSPGYGTNCIWWWSFSSSDIDSLVYLSIAINPKSTLTLSSSAFKILS